MAARRAMVRCSGAARSQNEEIGTHHVPASIGEKIMTGHIRRRSEHSWELKFDLGTDPLTGKRLTRYHSFKGTKREAAAELIRLKAGVDRSEYVNPSKVTLGEFLDRWETWASTQVSGKTLERYRELA